MSVVSSANKTDRHDIADKQMITTCIHFVNIDVHVHQRN